MFPKSGNKPTRTSYAQLRWNSW